MGWLRKLTGQGRERAGDRVESDVENEARLAKRSMVTTFLFAVEMREHGIAMLEHAARVSVIANRLGRRLEISEADAYVLQTAARIHEMGMVSVPMELVQRASSLSSAEVQAVRDHARVGAGMARSMYHPRVAMLIENQYSDYAQMRERLAPEDLLLAGVLRVADVIAAVTWPRPYQLPLAAARQVEILEGGAGVRFHPVVARFGVELRATEDLWRP